MNDFLRPEMVMSMWLWSTLSVMAIGIPFYLIERRFGAGKISLAFYGLLGLRLVLPIPAPWGALPPSPVWGAAVGILAAGALVMTARLLWLSWRTYRKALREEIAVPERASEVFVEARRRVGLRCRPVFLFTDAPFPAMVIGVIRPLVVMPRRAALSTPEELKHVVYHELTHLKKGDLIMNTFWQIAASLHWFNPVAKGLARRRRFHAETRCDELSCQALGGTEKGRVAYSRTLVEMAERGTPAEGALCLSESEYGLSARVERLLTPPKRSGWPVSVAAMATLLFATVAPLLTAQEAPEQPAPEPVPTQIRTTVLPMPVLPPIAPRLEFPAGKPVPEKPMQTREMAVSAKITGLHAEVETTLTFFNPNKRQLEGDLVFPLPDGAVVSGYALDVNGMLVDGVVVKKEKARVAFETETRRQVDPGIVEHVKGNIYRTRIYPLPPNASRTVKLRYVTELAADAKGDVALALGLPREKIGKLKISVRVANPDLQPEIGGFGNLRFAKIENTWAAETELENATPGADILVALPKLPKQIFAIERDAKGETYFMLSDLPPMVKEKSHRTGGVLSVAWDASGSRGAADRAKELAFLEKLAPAYASFKLCVFRDKPETIQTFPTFAALKAAIEAAPCDGGTDFNAMCAELKTGDWFLFTDGLDTLGAAPPTAQATFTAITSQSTGDREALRQLCKGSVIDLQRLDTAEAVALVLAPPRRVTGVEGSGIAAVQGIGTAVSGRVILTGRLTAPKAELRITYSDGSRSAAFALDASSADAGSLLATIWAAARITHLSARAEQNEEELLTLGQRFGLVSPATSLIVLENLDQYLRHEIRPPAQLAEMRQRWDDAIAQKTKSTADTTEHKFASVIGMWQQRVMWWEKGKKVERAANTQQRLGRAKAYFAVAKLDEAREEVERILHEDPQNIDAIRLRERISERKKRIDSNGGTTHDNGINTVSENWTPASVIASDESILADLEPVVDEISLPQTTQTVQSPAIRRAFDSVREVPSTLVMSGALSNSLRSSNSEPTPPQPEISGVEINNDTGAVLNSSLKQSKVSLGVGAQSSRIQVTAWNPDTPYLKAIMAATKTEREGVYFEARKTYEKSPAFFLDCADFFLKEGEARIGLRILSNLAELRIEDAALLRVFAWRLQQAGELDAAAVIFRRVTRLRPEDPQSWRDLALALTERGKRNRCAADLTEAQALFKKVILGIWNRTREVELFALEELNALMDWITRADWPEKPALIELDKRLRKNLDMDLRVVMAWDADATDMDLHVIEPSGEEAYYSHRFTSINGLVSVDITDGYGPEEYLLHKAPRGTYTIKAKYFGSRQQTVMGPATLVTRIYTDWGRPEEKCQTLTFRLNTNKEMIEVGKVAIGGNTVSASAPTELTLGQTTAEVEAKLGKPVSISGTIWFYTLGSRQWKLHFAGDKLLRVTELLPGGAEMIVVQ